MEEKKGISAVGHSVQGGSPVGRIQGSSGPIGHFLPIAAAGGARESGWLQPQRAEGLQHFPVTANAAGCQNDGAPGIAAVYALSIRGDHAGNPSHIAKLQLPGTLPTQQNASVFC